MQHYFDVFFCCSFFSLTKLNQQVFLGDPNSCASFSWKQERAQKLMEEGKLKKHNRYSHLFPEKQEREQKAKEEGSLHNCSKQ